MHQKKSENLSQTLIDKITNVAYKDAGIFETVSIYVRALFDKTVRKLLDEFRTTSKAVRRIHPEEFPEQLIEKVRSEIGLNLQKETHSSGLYRGFALILSDVRYSLAIVSFLILTIISFLVFQNTLSGPAYTKSEIELAKKQFNETMMIVNRVFKNTGDQVNQEVLKNHVAKPVNKGFSLFNELITGG
ncbi:MAG TPA: hypothetical protein VH917_05530 [Ignavibacteriaceae bacterium]